LRAFALFLQVEPLKDEMASERVSKYDGERYCEQNEENAKMKKIVRRDAWPNSASEESEKGYREFERERTA
jgi:hypothetical protein